MSIKEKLEKSKIFLKTRAGYWTPGKLLERNIFIAVVILLASFTSFALGRLSAMEEKKEPVRIAFPEEKIKEATAAAVISSVPHTQSTPALIPQEQEGRGEYVGSKNGTKYHLPWCSGAKRISEANKIWFADKQEAEKAGYAPAANCRGI